MRAQPPRAPPGASSFGWQMVLLCAFLLASALVSAMLLLTPEDRLARVWIALGPLLYLIALGGVAWWLVSRNPDLLWTPIPWFLVACAVYFGFGPTLYSFATSATVRYADAYYKVSSRNLLELQALNSIGTCLVVASSYMVLLLEQRTAGRSRQFIRTTPRTAAKILLTIGLPVQFLLVLPHELGLLPFLLPGSIQTLGVLATIALVPLTALALTDGGRHWALLAVVAAAEFASGLLLLSKMALLIPLIMLFMGFWYVRPSRRVLVAVGCGAVLVYFVGTSLVAVGRVGLGERTGSISGVGIRERVRILWHAWSEPGGTRGRPEVWWARLSYANAQSYAVDRYDAGSAGNSLRAAYYALIPRFLWPGKPVISKVGADFNREVTGNPDSQSAPGAFAEAYWNGGWLGVVAICLFVGLVLGGLSRYSLGVIRSGDLLLLPVVFLGIKAGFRPDGWIVLEYIGGVAIAFVLHGIITVLRSLVRGALRGGRTARIPKRTPQSCAFIPSPRG